MPRETSKRLYLIHIDTDNIPRRPGLFCGGESVEAGPATQVNDRLTLPLTN